jgi:nucleotide-binding universal stress UspA family protein
MRNILVPVDGSGNALRAVDHAARQAAGGRAKLHLLTVEPPLDDYGMVRAYLSARQHAKAMKLRSASILERYAARARTHNVKFTAHMAIGDVPNSIVRAARRLRCGSIVMGTRGMGPLKGLILGSVATKVLHLARVPVTLVK